MCQVGCFEAAVVAKTKLKHQFQIRMQKKKLNKQLTQLSSSLVEMSH